MEAWRKGDRDAHAAARMEEIAASRSPAACRKNLWRPSTYQPSLRDTLHTTMQDPCSFQSWASPGMSLPTGRKLVAASAPSDAGWLQSLLSVLADGGEMNADEASCNRVQK